MGNKKETKKTKIKGKKKGNKGAIFKVRRYNGNNIILSPDLKESGLETARSLCRSLNIDTYCIYIYIYIYVYMG